VNFCFIVTSQTSSYLPGVLPIVQVTQAPPVVEMRSKGLVDVVVTGLLCELSLLQLLPRIATNKYAVQSYYIALIHNVIIIP